MNRVKKGGMQGNATILQLLLSGRGVSEKVSAVGFCLGSGLFDSCNSN